MKYNWTTKKLSEIAYINPRESIGKGVVAKKVPMDKLQPFCRDVPEFVLEEYKGGTKFINGDTIMARITPCLENGKIAKVSILSDDEVGFGSTEYIVFRAIDGVSDADFLYYLICSPLIRNPAIKSMVGSSGRQRVQTDVVANLDIELPPIEEQRKIGGLLKAIDDKIELNNKINNNLEQQASVLVRQYCESLTSSVELGTVLSFENGFAFQSSSYHEKGKYRIITIKNVQDGRIDAQGAACINDIPPHMKQGCFLTIGDVLLSLTGNVGRVGIVCENDLLLNQRVAKFIPKDIRTLPLLYFYFRLHSTKISLETISKGTAQQNLSPIETLKLEIPYETKQALELSNLLQPIFDTIYQKNIENIQLAEIRDSLLPKLMSGELDVSDIDI